MAEVSMAKYEVNVDWEKVHLAFQKLDTARRDTGSSPVGRDALYDALGGSYYGPTYEGEGLRGLVKLIQAERTIREALWTALHGVKEPVRAMKLMRVVFALDETNWVLSQTGLEARAGHNVICGVGSSFVAVTGLCWLVGLREDRRIPLVAAQTFAANGDLEQLRAALTEAPRETYGNF